MTKGRTTRPREARKMTTWKITNRKSGQDLGTYEGETAEDAIRAMWRDAGYRTDQDAADACGCTVDDLMAECDVREVESRGRSLLAVAKVVLACGPVDLYRDSDRYRWYGLDGDIEVSGATVADAARALLAAYPDSEHTR